MRSHPLDAESDTAPEVQTFGTGVLFSLLVRQVARFHGPLIAFQRSNFWNTASRWSWACQKWKHDPQAPISQKLRFGGLDGTLPRRTPDLKAESAAMGPSWHSDDIAFIAPCTDIAMHFVVSSRLVAVTNAVRARCDYLFSASFEFSIVEHKAPIAISFEFFVNP
jgi:hypothetical protein